MSTLRDKLIPLCIDHRFEFRAALERERGGTLTRLVAIADAAAQFSTEHDAGWGHWPMFAALRQALERSEG